MSLLPESLRGGAKTLDTDPFRYLRGVIAFFMGGGAVVALRARHFAGAAVP